MIGCCPFLGYPRSKRARFRYDRPMTPYEHILLEENAALRAALQHLVLYCDRNNIKGIAVTLAKNCLKKREKRDNIVNPVGICLTPHSRYDLRRSAALALMSPSVKRCPRSFNIAAMR